MVPITVEDEVSFTNKYSLIATINHSGTLNRGHYWAFIKDLHSSSWYSCNDKLIFNVEERSLSNTSSYILFYRKVWMFPRMYQTFWRVFFVFFAREFCHFRHFLWLWQPHIEISSRTTLQFFNGTLTFWLKLGLSVAGVRASFCFWSMQWFEKVLFKCFRSTVKNTHRN